MREHFFNTPALKALVADWSDDDIWLLNRGGHDPHKVYAAYGRGQPHRPAHRDPAKTIKGYGMGEAGEAQNITHQQKHMRVETLARFRERFRLPLSDEQLADLSYLKFEEGSREHAYLHERRQALGGYLPSRRRTGPSLPVPPLSAFDTQLKASGDGREFSTAMSFVRILNGLLRDKVLGRRIVPIVSDESRTFGMEGLFRQIGIWSQQGQTYTPQDASQLSFYKESKDSQILQKASTKRAPWPNGSPLPRRTARTASR